MSNCISDEEGFVFLAQNLTQADSEPEETEVLSIRRLPFTEALAMVLDGRITDAITVAALQRVRLLGLA